MAMAILFLIVSSVISIALALKSTVFFANNPQAFSNYCFITESNFDEELTQELIKTSTQLQAKLIVRSPPDILILLFHYSKLSSKFPQMPRFGPHRFTHIFLHVTNEQTLTYWKQLYARLYLTKFKYQNFYNSFRGSRKYPHFTPTTFEEDYWHSQWNQDKFLIKSPDSNAVLSSVRWGDHLPPDLQQNSRDLSEFKALFFTSLGGWGGSRCKFYTFDEQLWELTHSYNAFDMMFCEAFNYFNASFTPNYDFDNFFYWRHFLLRDDFISSHPPDSNALFYATPGITFILLKEDPITWGNILRPFSFSLWVVMGVCIIFIVVISIFLFPMSGSKLLPKGSAEDSKTIDASDSAQVWKTSVAMFRFILMAAYSGMILAGYLYPSYPWTPNTFSELNATTNYVASIGFVSAVSGDLLKRTGTLSGITQWVEKPFPSKEEHVEYPGEFLKIDEADEERRYAVLMYSDKKNHYMYAKNILTATMNYIHRLETNKELVLVETRYMSTSSVATKLHFLIDAIRQIFETGVYLRWKYLEDNYFSYIAPALVPKYGGPKISNGVTFRSLNFWDVQTTLVLLAGGLALAEGIYLAEDYRNIIFNVKKHLIDAISYLLLTPLIWMFGGLGVCLMTMKRRLQQERKL